MAKNKPNARQPSEVAAIAASRVIDSRRLLYFVHVARSGSFTAAEAALDIAQSALSRQIRQLENDLGTKLLERRGHGVEPTATGHVLLQYASEVLELMGTALDEVSTSKLGARDRVSLAVSRPFSTTYVPDVLVRFNKKYPQIHVTVFEASSGQVYEMLTTGVVDTAVVLLQANSPKISTVKLFDESLMVIGRGDDPDLASPVIERSDLSRLKLMLPAAPFGTRAILERYFYDGGVSLDPTFRFDSVSLMAEMIRRNGYCAILPESACTSELESGEFVARPVNPGLHRTLRLAHMRDRKQPEALTALRETLVSVVEERHG
ncbi:LysR family transcriptional regulator [Nocardioides rotundus]|uniref:LysR family transcriptional regulator n=1 Tax=Nocardioides rotundus TaxID=1774216 RepID=UPI001CBAB7BA|nr:LysR family transcriptional regulator [Nocardioides rotundus]UAL29952.1 LysR family transcriptional regulator [Nocardioides rotundus]